MLKFENVTFSYGEKTILRDFSFELKKGEVVALMGASGIGKSTVLNLAAGFCKPQEGQIIRSAERISYAFQEPRLFPWLNVLENVNAVLAANKTTKEDALKALDLVALSDSAALFPAELSGGMKSRVSLARAIAYNGDLFLLDEPFAALDEELRHRLAGGILDHIRKCGASCLIVTHQREDAELADRIITL